MGLPYSEKNSSPGAVRAPQPEFERSSERDEPHHSGEERPQNAGVPTRDSRSRVALLESEARFRAFTEATSEIVYRMSADWRELSHLQGREFIADTLAPTNSWLDKYIHPDDQPRLMEAIDQAVRTKSVFEMEHRVIQTDGTLGWAYSRAIPILDDNGEIAEWFGTATNITRRKLAEESLERQRQMYEGVLATTPDLAYIFGLDHRFVYANEGLLRMWGKTWDEAIGRNCLELGYEPWHAEMHGREIDQVVVTKQPVRGVVPFTGTFGRRLYDYILTPVLDAHGRVQAVAGITRDVTDIKLTEERLLESEERLAAELAGMKRLHELSTRLAQQDDLREVMREVMDAAAELLGAEYCTAQLVDRHDGSLRLVAVRGFDREFADRFTLVGPGDRTTCVASLTARQRVIVSDLASAPEFVEFATLAAPLGIAAAMSTPLLGDDGELLGVFTTYWQQPHTPGESQLRLLDLYVQQAARQVERRAAEQAVRESREQLAAEVADLETLRQLSLRIAATGDRTAALDDVLETAIAMVGAAKGNVQLYDAADETLKIIAHRGFDSDFLEYFRSVPAGFSCCGAAMQDGERVIIEDVTADPRFSDLAGTYAKYGFLAVQSTPLFTSDGRLIGMFSTHFARPHRPSERDLRLLDQIAQQAGRIIERSQAESALRASEEQLTGMFSQAAVGVMLLDAPSCAILKVNPKFCEIVGYSEAELLGRSSLDITHNEDRAENERLIREVINGGPATATLEKRYVCKDGETVWVRYNLARLSPDSQGQVRLMAVVEDISEWKRVQQELVLAKEGAESANRAKDDFLAVLSHELRSPLNSMHGWTQILMAGETDPETLREGMEVIERNVRLQNKLIEDLLDVSSIISGKMQLNYEPFPVDAAVRSAVESVRPVASKANVSLALTIEPGAGEIRGDRHRLQQIVDNLLTNAIKFTPPGGKVTVDLARQNGTVSLSVTDTGIGMPEELVPHIFDRFRQAKSGYNREFGGLGLGLAIVKSLAELHGGEVRAHSEGPGRGSTFVVTLPAAETHGTATQAATLSENSMIGDLAGVKVLLVDDDPDTLNFLRFALERLGAAATCCSDPDEVLSAAQSGRFDLIVSDIGMSPMDGIELIGRIREQENGHGSLPAIALSGFVTLDDRDRALSAGFQRHLSKPVDLGTLRQAIRELVVPR